jgi:hypothetical protein
MSHYSDRHIERSQSTDACTLMLLHRTLRCANAARWKHFIVRICRQSTGVEHTATRAIRPIILRIHMDRIQSAPGMRIASQKSHAFA